MDEKPEKVHYSLNFKLYSNEKFFGPGVARLLRKVDETASLRAAAADLKIAYSKAWSMIRTAERTLGYDLLIKKTGGIHGGGAQLTPEGRALLDKYSAFEKAIYRSADAMWKQFFPEFAEGKQAAAVQAGTPEIKGNGIGAILMASGFSRRMGYNKLLLNLGEKTVAEYILDQLRRQDYAAVVVVSQYTEILEMAKNRGFVPVMNPMATEGKSSSVRLGLKALAKTEGLRGFIFFTGDQILLSDSLLQQLSDTFAAHPDKIVYPEYEGKFGSPAVFPADLVPELLKLKEEQGGRVVADHYRDRKLAVPVKPVWQGFDFDCPEDWEKVRQLWNCENKNCNKNCEIS